MHVSHCVPLAPLTTLRLGGPAAALIELSNLADFPDIVEWAGRHGSTTPVCLGHGSNVLVSDSGCTRPVLRVTTRGIKLLGPADNGRVLVEVQAGQPLRDLVDTCLAEGLSGLEMLAGVPGTAGATPVQNVGAYGQEIGDILVRVVAWDWKLGRRVTLDAADCQLGHRTSMFKGSSRWTLLVLVLALHRSDLSAPITYRSVADVLDVPLGSRVPLKEVAEAVLTIRRSKGMVLEDSGVDRRTVGSVFLSPEVPTGQLAALRRLGAPVSTFPDRSTRVSASWTIRAAGFTLRAPVARGVRISSQHYTLVADSGASAASFAKAIGIVSRTVMERTGIALTSEIDGIGDVRWSPAAHGRVPALGRYQ
ncbi:UDP-N-acetylmuramate dehydrogenase [Streptomyces silvisoli]|uniref:UDP-N-acetylenolpyruvoylglucosamine reductase n=1 Tax=Streptomyces silvisoli TaxID=3034235 RepID=A0ABT5ZWP6_9ACTN|nr:UDP-N-acetylmuramate dehydrogenase [Streptomyces silvisoli]MDF3293934.1 UDP-N-acetylmuramate dehydrogenase [Streptomyces silvisoli]